MPLAHELSSPTDRAALQRRCSFVRDALIRDGVYDSAQEGPRDRPEDGALISQADHSPGSRPGFASSVTTRWRISPGPFLLSRDELTFFRRLGTHLLAFYRSVNRLYLESVRGVQPAWVAAYLDQGKPESLVSYSRMKRVRDRLPGVIRPDIIPTDEGMVITELDSVPGGIGLTGALARAYIKAYSEWPMADGQEENENSPSPTSPPHASRLTPHPFEIVGGADGMVQGFATMLRHQMGERTGCVAVVVSDEAKDYRPEMAWMAARLREAGVEAYCVEPREVRFTEETLLVRSQTGDRPVSLVYRFFELFDLKNVPKAELIMYSAKKDRTGVTPPFKPALEEKLAFALLHHPVLAPFWKRDLGDETFGILTGLMPHTWILDPRPLPPVAVIPGLHVAGRTVADWHELAGASQKDRRYVIKPSGFSELAWGSRGISVGHDLPQSDWAAALDRALAAFPTTPYILQEFHKGRPFDLSYYDAQTDRIVPMAGRARLSPYYFVTGDSAELAGVLATVCPLDKKVIHGMRDAIMVPCAVPA